MPCLSDNTLAELIEARLPESRRREVLAELAHCDSCRELARSWAAASWQLSEEAPSAESAPASGNTDASPTIGVYRLEEPLGAGASGIVFRAFDPTLARPVALKLLRVATGADAERALDEGKRLASLRHPAVIQVYAAGTTANLAFLAMELVEGSSLDRVLAQGPLPWRQAARWFAGVAAGLDAVHRAGLVHRDIKPANLLVDQDRLRLADFGLATARGSTRVAGTRGYVAPEVVAGAPADPAADQYSLCVTLLHAVTGELPSGDPTVVVRGVPRPLRPILLRGLALEPGRRWERLEDVSRRLAQVSSPWRFTVSQIALALAALVVVAAATAMVIGDTSSTCQPPQLGWSSTDAEVKVKLEAFANSWVHAHRATCRDSRKAQQRECLDELASRARDLASASSLGAGVGAAIASLPSAELCLRPATTAHVPLGIRMQLRTARGLASLGRFGEAAAILPAGEDEWTEVAMQRAEIAASTMNHLGNEHALRRAVDLATRDGNDALLLEAAHKLGRLVAAVWDRYEAGEAYLQVARAAAMRRNDASGLRSVRATTAYLVGLQGDATKALALLGEVAEEQLLAFEPRAATHLMQGILLKRLGEPSRARPYLLAAHQLRAAELGVDHPTTVAVEIEVATVDAAAGDPAKARATLVARIEQLERALGVHHVRLGPALHALGVIDVNAGDFAAARNAFARVRDLYAVGFGERTTSVAEASLNLASTCYYQGDSECAIATYRTALAIARSALGGGSELVAQVHSGLALALQRADQLDEASTHIEDAIEVIRNLPGHDRQLANTLTNAGLIHLARDKAVAARRAFDEALTLLEPLPQSALDRATVIGLRGELHLTENSFADARRDFEAARALKVEHGGTPRDLWEADFLLAKARWHLGERRAARALAEQTLRAMGSEAPDLRQFIRAWLRDPGRN